MAKWQDYNEYFEKAATTYNVDKRLLISVAKTESDFNPKATSGAGAKGIMQLMDGTAKSLGVKDSYDPEQNIMGGAKLLSQLLKKYDGNRNKALAAYNAGSGNVARYGAKKYSSYYNKVNANEKKLFGEGSPDEQALDILKKKADEKIKESDEKYWGKEITFTDVLTVVITILFGIASFVFIALALNVKVKTDTNDRIEHNATKKINKMIKNGQLEASNKEEYIKREIKHQKKRENKHQKKRGVKK